MKYSDMVTAISERTRLPKKYVKEVMDTFTDVLLDMKVGDRVITPMGHFICNYRKSRPIRLPDDQGIGTVKEKVTFKLRPSKRLRIDPDHPRWDYLTTPRADTDSEP